MKKILLINLIFSSVLFSKTFYYMKYEQHGKMGTSEITEEAYFKVKTENKKFYLDENDELVKVLRVYKERYGDINTYTEEQENIKSKTQAVHKEAIKEELTETDRTISSFDIKEHLTAHRLFILIVVLIFIYKFLKKKNFFKNKTEFIEEHQEPVIKPANEIKTEAVATQNINNLDYKDLDEKRKKIYSDFKSDTRFDKEKKKLIYRRLSQLRKDIISKKDLSLLNQEINQIEEVINNV